MRNVRTYIHYIIMYFYDLLFIIIRLYLYIWFLANNCLIKKIEVNLFFVHTVEKIFLSVMITVINKV